MTNYYFLNFFFFLPKSLSQESGASPRCRQAPLFPIWQAFAIDVTKYSSSVFLQPHQLISGWLQRAITAPFLWCLNTSNHQKTRIKVEASEGFQRVNQPVDDHRDPLPGSKGCHTLQLLVGDPYWDKKLLRVAGAQPDEHTHATHYYNRKKDKTCACVTAEQCGCSDWIHCHFASKLEHSPHAHVQGHNCSTMHRDAGRRQLSLFSSSSSTPMTLSNFCSPVHCLGGECVCYTEGERTHCRVTVPSRMELVSLVSCLVCLPSAAAGCAISSLSRCLEEDLFPQTVNKSKHQTRKWLNLIRPERDFQNRIKQLFTKA